MSSEDLKRAVALAALEYVKPNSILGVGTGTTVNHFIEQLSAHGPKLQAAVSSSEASTERLLAAGIPVKPMNELDRLALYVDGADECDPNKYLIKGGGGALTREKIVAEASDEFVCIVDESKMVQTLGAFPLPVEVIPMARRQVALRLKEIGGDPVYRAGFTTDNGNDILDVSGMQIEEPVALEREITTMVGVVTVGLFARRAADVVLVGAPTGVRHV